LVCLPSPKKIPPLYESRLTPGGCEPLLDSPINLTQMNSKYLPQSLQNRVLFFRFTLMTPKLDQAFLIRHSSFRHSPWRQSLCPASLFFFALFRFTPDHIGTQFPLCRRSFKLMGARTRRSSPQTRLTRIDFLCLLSYLVPFLNLEYSRTTKFFYPPTFSPTVLTCGQSSSGACFNRGPPPHLHVLMARPTHSIVGL